MGDGVTALFPDPAPPSLPGIDLRCCDVTDLLDEVRGAALVFADPPWGEYRNHPGEACPAEAGGTTYPVLTYREIAAHLDAAVDCCRPGARLVLWSTWPLDEEIRAAGIPGRGWMYKTGGAWNKLRHHGTGHHWAGCSEPVRIYQRPGAGYRDTTVPLRSGYQSRPGPHSAKPVEWQADMIRRWTRPGELILDLYAGDGTVARAALATGRPYIGAEIDPARHARAMGLLLRVRR